MTNQDSYLLVDNVSVTIWSLSYPLSLIMTKLSFNNNVSQELLHHHPKIIIIQNLCWQNQAKICRRMHPAYRCKFWTVCDFMWDSAEHDIRGWHRHAWEGICLMDYGQLSRAEGHCQAGGEQCALRAGTVDSLNHSSAVSL